MKAKTKKGKAGSWAISDNDLSELNSMMFEIKGVIKKYRHVSDNIPEYLANAISDFHIHIIVETIKREDDEV